MGLNEKFFVPSASGADPAADPFGDGSCRAFYKLDSDVNDYSGNNLNGSKGSSVSFSSSGGEYDGFANVTSVNANGIMTFPITPIPNETHAFWMRKPVMSAGQTLYLLTVGSGSTDWWSVGMFNDAGTLKMWMQWRQGSAQYRYTQQNVGISVSSTDWFFMTLRTNDNKHYFSLNGGNETELTSTISAGTMNNSYYTTDNTNMFVGRNYINGTNFYGVGFDLDHYRLFNRNLTNTEIDTLYQE